MYHEGRIITWDNPELTNFYGAPSSKKSTNASYMNQITHINWFERLKLIALSIYHWEGLPDGIEGEWIEECLFRHGKLAFFKTGETDIPVSTILALPFSSQSEVNIYGKPMVIRCQGRTSREFSVPIHDAIILKANKTGYPTMDTAGLYAYRLTKVERALDVNIQNQKFPFVFKGTESQKLAAMNFMHNFNENEPYFIVDETFAGDGFNQKFDIFNTNAPYVADKLMLYKHDIINEYLTFIGLSNANTDKKERLITSEVDANNEEVKISVSSGLTLRQKVADEINLRFGLNVTVSEQDMSEADFGLTDYTEEDKNEFLHD